MMLLLLLLPALLLLVEGMSSFAVIEEVIVENVDELRCCLSRPAYSDRWLEPAASLAVLIQCLLQICQLGSVEDGADALVRIWQKREVRSVSWSKGSRRHWTITAAKFVDLIAVYIRTSVTSDLSEHT